MKLNWRQWGSRQRGIPILLLHGHPGQSTSMTVFAEGLQDSAWLIAPDLRGYGQSPAPQPFQMQDHVSDLTQLLDDLGIQDCVLLGWSLGGILALELALANPARIRGLILVASAARPRGSHPPIRFWDDFYTGIASIVNWIRPGWEWNITTFGQRSLYRFLVQQHTPQTYQYLAKYALTAYLQTSRYAQKALQQALQQGYNRLPDLANVSQPTLVLAGEQDRHITATASRETATALPQATWILYEQTAHLFPWEIPTQVQHDIRQWLHQQGWL